MLTGYMFDRIRSLRNQEKNISQIARELKIDRKTVRKYLRSNTPPSYSSRKARTSPDPFAPFEERARVLLKQNEEWNPVDLYEVLKEEGFSGSEKTVRRRMLFLRPPPSQERFFEQKYTPGEQVQMDFKENFPFPFVNGDRIVNLFFGTLPFSDHFFIKGFPFKNLECFQEGMHSLFEDIGGMTNAIRIDNLAPCVKKVLEGNERIYTDDFNQTIRYYGFKVLPCGPGKGNHKGDVEREIRTHARRLQKLAKFQKIKFRDFDHFNQWLAAYTAKRLPLKARERLQEEKKFLLPLPARDEEILCRIENFVGGPYGTVTLRDAVYSIPDSFIGRSCKAVLAPTEIRLTAKGVPGVVVVHPRQSEGGKSILLEHILPSLLRKPGAMVRWAHREILFPTQALKSFYRYLKGLDPLRAEKNFLKSVNLIQHTSWKDLEVGMELIQESASLRPFEDLKELLLAERRPVSAVVDGQLPLRPDLTIYDQLIPQS